MIEYRVLSWDWNKNKPVWKNIINESLLMDIKLLITSGHIQSRYDLKKWLLEKFRLKYWARRECEIEIGDLNANEHIKIDTYYQLNNNIDAITDLILFELKPRFKRKEYYHIAEALDESLKEVRQIREGAVTPTTWEQLKIDLDNNK